MRQIQILEAVLYNTVTGYKMAKHFIYVAPQAVGSANAIDHNNCKDVE